MRSIIYDIITGIAIVLGLFVITDVMKANQTFIMNQGVAETDTEQVYLNEDAATQENTYTAADVYGCFHTILKNGNITENSSTWVVMDYYKMEVVSKCGSKIVAYENCPSEHGTVHDMEVLLKKIIKQEDGINIKFTRKKTVEEENGHTVIRYTFEEK